MNEPVWYRRNADRSDRFAGAVDGGDAAEFENELAVVASLRAVADEPVLDANARRRILATIEARWEAEDEAHRESVRPLRPKDANVRRKHRASLIAAAVAAAVMAFGALGIELSRNALPGDLLYSVKRTTESLTLDLTFSDDSKAHKHLDQAETRVSELAMLAERYATSDAGAVDAGSFNTVLADFNRSATQGASGITELATRGDGAELAMLREWAVEQTASLHQVKLNVPSAVEPDLLASIDLVERIEQRAVDLIDRMRCTQVTTGEMDELGPLPATGACEPNPQAPPQTAIETRGSSQPADAGTPGSQQSPRTTSPDDSGGTADSGGGTPTTPSGAQPPVEGDPPPGVDLPDLPEPSVPPIDSGADGGGQAPTSTEAKFPVFPW